MALSTDYLLGLAAYSENTEGYAKSHGMDPNQVTSPTGAIGLYQIEPGTAQSVGIDPATLKDPVQNKEAATRYINQLQSHGLADDIDTFLVAYHNGPGGARQWLASGRQFYSLGPQTQNYLTRGRGYSGAAVNEPAQEVPDVLHQAQAQAYHDTITHLQSNQQVATGKLWSGFAQAREAGYSWDEINQAVDTARQQALQAGYSNKDVNLALGLSPMSGGWVNDVPAAKAPPEEVQPSTIANIFHYLDEHLPFTAANVETAEHTVQGLRELQDKLYPKDTNPETIKLIGNILDGKPYTDFQVAQALGWDVLHMGRVMGSSILGGMAALIELSERKDRTTDEITRLAVEAQNFTSLFAEGGIGFAGRPKAEVPAPPLPPPREFVDAATMIARHQENVGKPQFVTSLPIIDHAEISRLSRTAQLNERLTKLQSEHETLARNEEPDSPVLRNNENSIASVQSDLNDIAYERAKQRMDDIMSGLGQKFVQDHTPPQSSLFEIQAGSPIELEGPGRPITAEELKNAQDAFIDRGDPPDTNTPIQLAGKLRDWKTNTELLMQQAGILKRDEAGVLNLAKQQQMPYPRQTMPLPVNTQTLLVPARPGGLGAQLTRSFRSVFRPMFLNEATEVAGGVLREQMAQEALQRQLDYQNMRRFGRAIGNMTPAQRMDFVDAIERGDVAQYKGQVLSGPNPFAGTELEKMAIEIRTALDERFAAANQRGIIDSYIQGYMKHMYRKPNVAGQWLGENVRPLQGKQDFTRQRFYQTYHDAIAAGLEPLTTNPADMALAALHSLDKSILAHDSLMELRGRGVLRTSEDLQNGVAMSIQSGKLYTPKATIPAGWRQLDPKIGMLRIDGENKILYAPDEVAHLLENMMSPGLQNIDMLEAARQANAALVAIKLFISLFHGTLVTADSFITGLSEFANILSGARRAAQRGQMGLAAEEAGAAMIKLPAALVSPARYQTLGFKLRRQLLGVEDYGTKWQELAHAYIAGGGRLRQGPDLLAGTKGGDFWDSFVASVTKSSNQFEGARTFTQELDQMWENIRLAQESPGAAYAKPLAALSFTWQTFTRLMATTMRPLFGVFVPQMKMGAFASMMQDALRVAPNMDIVQMRKVAGHINDALDNRLGELVMENNFWNRSSVDLSRILFLSSSFFAGDVRTIAGGLGDVLTRKKIDIGPVTRSSQGRSYLIALPVGMYMLNSMLSWYHGTEEQYQQGILDALGQVYEGDVLNGMKQALINTAFYPSDPNDPTARSVVPGYLRTAIEYLLTGSGEVLNELTPLIGAWNEIQPQNNRDYRGAMVVDWQQDSFTGKADDIARALWNIMKPTVWEAMRHGIEMINGVPLDPAIGNPNSLTTFEQLLGERPAPRSAVPTQKEAGYLVREAIHARIQQEQEKQNEAQ